MLVTMVFFADSLLVGWMRDPEALAAVSMGAQFGYCQLALFGHRHQRHGPGGPLLGRARLRTRPPGRRAGRDAIIDIFGRRHRRRAGGGLVGYDAGLDCSV